MEHGKWFYIFFGCVLLGTILSFRPGGVIVGFPLVKGGMEGLLAEQQREIAAEEFQRYIFKRELEEQHRRNEYEREMQRRNLVRPALPIEGY